MYGTTSSLPSKQGGGKAKTVLSVNYYGFRDMHCDTIAKEMTVMRSLRILSKIGTATRSAIIGSESSV